MQAEKLPPTAPVVEEQVENGKISIENYLEHYAEHHYEYIQGQIVSLLPMRDTHYFMMSFLANLLNTYLAIKPIGTTRKAAFLMRMEKDLWREPNIQVILGDNQQNLKSTYMDGAADICIEVVSPESDARDHGDKFTEYEKYGVKEYWIIDPIRKQATFHRLSEKNLYQPQQIIEDYYQTPLLPELRLHVPTLWQSPLPDIIQTVKPVQDMLAEG